MRNRCCIAFASLFFLCLLPGTMLAAAVAPATRGMVASGNPLATEAGLNVLKNGGNAIDAAVAVGLTLGVVDTQNSGIGGGCFMLIRRANGSIVAIDGRETAPWLATRDMFIVNGAADPDLSQTGALASGVPGELAAFDYAVRKFGRKKLADLILPASHIAEQGFAIDQTYATRLRSVADEMNRFEATRRIFLKEGKPLSEGEWLRQPDLANTYRQIAHHGIKWFYRGPFAAATEEWMKPNGGILTARDFAAYRIVRRDPVSTLYRGRQVVSFPPPSSGGVHLIQMLNMLERFEVTAMEEGERAHVLAEVMKLAFADRAHWLGDPAFAQVPRGLLSKAYATSLAQKIRLDQTTPVAGHGSPPGWERDTFPKHTTHFSVADAEGNWVACTATINTSFGSKVVIPGTGVVMNNQMDDFSAQPGVPNYFGLVGAEANAVAPGKRPLSSMTPTIVLEQGKPILALGAAGGPRIISCVFAQLVGILDLGQSPAEAMAAPRIHHQWSPDEVAVEQSLPDGIQNALRSRGHKLLEQNALSTAHSVSRTPDRRAFTGAADPRSRGTAQGW